MPALLYSQLFYSGKGLSLLIITIYIQIETQQLFSLGVYCEKKKEMGLLNLEKALETYWTVL